MTQTKRAGTKKTVPVAEARRRVRGTAAVLFLLAVAMRYVFFRQLADTPFFSNVFSDSRIYLDLARTILDGQGVARAYFMSPLYPYVLAAVDAVTGNALVWARVLQIALGGGTVVLVYLSARRAAGEWGAIAAALLAAVYPPFIFYDNALLLASLQTFLVAAQLYLLFIAWESPRKLPWILAGVAMGLSIVNRASIGLFLPVLLVLLWIRRRGIRAGWKVAALSYTGAALLMIVPWTVHNYSAEGVLVPVTASGGYNFYAGNNAEAAGNYSMPDDVDLYTDPNGARYVERLNGRRMNSAEISSWWSSRAWRWIGENPGSALGLFGRKLMLFLHPGEDDQLGLSMQFFQTAYDTVLDLPLPGFPVVLLLAMLGAAYMLRQKWEMQIVAAFALSIMVSTAVFFVNGRLRVPVTPLLLVAAASAVHILIGARRGASTRTLIVPSTIALVAFAAVMLVQPELPTQFSLEYNKLGEIAFDSGNYPRAEEQFRRSLQERQSAFGHVNLGNVLAATGRREEARAEYNAALQIDSTYALGWFNLGNLAMEQGSPGAALGYWSMALRFQPDLAAAHRNLGLLLMRGGRAREALEHFEQYLVLEQDARKREEIARDVSTLRSYLQGAGK